VFVFVTTVLKAFLNYITCKLMIAQLYDHPFNAFDNLIFVFLTLTMLKHMLNHIVPKLVFSKTMYLSKYLVKNRSCLLIRTVLKHSLNDSTPISMNAKLRNSISDCLNNEINRVRIHLFYAFLDHVISILVINTI